MLAALFGQVQVGRDIKLGETLEDDFLDGVARTVDPSRHARIQRPTVVREPTQQLQNFGAHLRLASLRFGHGVDFCQRGLTIGELLLRDAVHPAE